MTEDQREENIAPGRHRAVEGYDNEVAYGQNDQIREDGEPENHWVQNRVRRQTLGLTVFLLNGGRTVRPRNRGPAQVTHVHPLQSDARSPQPILEL